jgi:hypothetical protein
MVSITKHIRTTVTTLMSDSTSGFNANFETVCEAYNINPFFIDFGAKSKNFYQSYIGYNELIQTSNFKFPVMCLYTTKTQNQNTEFSRLFSGTSGLGIDVYLSWPKSSAVLDTETLGDAVSDAMYNMFNHQTASYGDILPNGDLTIQRGPLVLGGDNWLQLLQCRLSVDYNA